MDCRVIGEDSAIESFVYQVTPRLSANDILSLVISQFFCSQVLRDHLQWWTDFSSLKEVPLLHQKEHNLLALLDVFFKGWDAQLWHQTASGLLYHEESRLHINRATTFRIIWKSDSDSKSVDFHRQFFSRFLSEQVGRYPLSGMCFLI